MTCRFPPMFIGQMNFLILSPVTEIQFIMIIHPNKRMFTLSYNHIIPIVLYACLSLNNGILYHNSNKIKGYGTSDLNLTIHYVLYVKCIICCWYYIIR